MSFRPKAPCEKVRQLKVSSKVDVRACSHTKSEPRAKSNRSNSAGTLNNITNTVRPKKTTKSEQLVTNKGEKVTPKLNNCRACGDAPPGAQNKRSNVFIGMNGVRRTEGVQQYFRNKNFRQSSASIPGAESLKKVSNLNTINELSEENIHERPTPKAFSDISSDDEDTEASDIKELKKFRRDNYLECHSTAAKLKSGSLKDHKCLYRFYLNERLFPVPLGTDYNKIIRCEDCHLPLENTSSVKDVNGTIQAKVRMNGKIQDMMLMLPVGRSLIIQQRREERKEQEPLYFGVVRLSQDGHSAFHRNLPGNSLALRYQKGYQELRSHEKYEYERVDSDEVIVV